MQNVESTGWGGARVAAVALPAIQPHNRGDMRQITDSIFAKAPKVHDFPTYYWEFPKRHWGWTVTRQIMGNEQIWWRVPSWISSAVEAIKESA